MEMTVKLKWDGDNLGEGWMNIYNLEVCLYSINHTLRKLCSAELVTDKLTASEALFGLTGWLTTRDEETIMSAHHDCSNIAQLVSQFIAENKLDEPREGWANNLIHPNGECSGPAV